MILLAIHRGNERVTNQKSGKIRLTSTATAPQGELAKNYWSEAEAAASLGVAHFTLRKWRQGGYVSAATTTRPILYTREDIDAIAKWMRTRDRCQ